MTSAPPGRTSCAERSSYFPAENVEHHVHFADVLQPALLEICKGVGAKVEHSLPVRGASAADHTGSRIDRELNRERSDAARRAVNQDGLPGGQMTVVEQGLPRGQSGHWQRRGHHVVDSIRQRREIAGLHRDVFRQRSVAAPVCEPEDALAYLEPGCAVT